MRLLNGSILGAVLAALLTVTTPAVGQAAAPGPTAFKLEGKGWGHGHGMSQYGAQGAAKRGLGHRQIEQFYYPGTRVGKAGGAIKVLITAETRNSLAVAARPGLRVRSTKTGSSWKAVNRGARRYRLVPANGNRSTRLYVLKNQWRYVRTIPGGAEFYGGPMRMILPNGSVTYRGRLRSAPANGGRDAVNVLPIDSYVRGVVAREMPSAWHVQALRAQAVAARTYAIFERDSTDRGHFDVYDTTRSQVYGGVGAETTRTNAAVVATAGEIRTYGGRAAFTQFSSSNGGWTVAGGKPYLVAKKDPYDPVRPWAGTATDAELEGAWPEVGDVQSITVTKRDGHGLWGGRALEVEIVGSLKTITVGGDDFRFATGGLSTLFHVV